MQKQLYIAFGALLALTSCQSASERYANQRPATAEERQSIVEGARVALKDPYSVRDAEVSYFLPSATDPKAGNICVMGNAKNSFGAYGGRKGFMVAIDHGRAVNVWEDHPLCTSGMLKYQPFPEIYKLRGL